MKRINPFSKDFETIKKARNLKHVKNRDKHLYGIEKEMEDFYECWWNFRFDTSQEYVKKFINEYTIWDKYNNQLALEIYDIEEDLKYIESLPEDYKQQNHIIDEYNRFIEWGDVFHQKVYYHYYLCIFK